MKVRDTGLRALLGMMLLGSSILLSGCGRVSPRAERSSLGQGAVSSAITRRPSFAGSRTGQGALRGETRSRLEPVLAADPEPATAPDLATLAGSPIPTFVTAAPLDFNEAISGSGSSIASRPLDREILRQDPSRIRRTIDEETALTPEQPIQGARPEDPGPIRLD